MELCILISTYFNIQLIYCFEKDVKIICKLYGFITFKRTLSFKT